MDHSLLLVSETSYQRILYHDRLLLICTVQNKRMERFNPRDAFYSGEIERWAQQVNLDPDPRMPAQIIGRDEDNWRPLIAIGHAVDRADLAYKVMVEFYKEGTTINIKESLLRDIHRVFMDANANILTNEMLLNKLLSLKDGEVDWSEYKLTKAKISRMMSNFQIANQPHLYEGRTLARCWFAADFEKMWARYE